MRALLQALEPVHICVVSEPTPLELALIPVEEFLATYGNYANALKAGKMSDERSLRRTFSSAFTCDLSAVYAMAVASGKYLIKPIKPVIQLQAHHFFYSDLDKQFHPMVLSEESVTWGIQFSYPQLCQDPKTSEILKVSKGRDFPNTELFAVLGKWLRDHTLPTPFIVEGKRTNAPIRIGKQALHWVNKHPQLSQKKIEVFSFSASNLG